MDHDRPPSELGAYLQRAREEKGMSRADLAAKTHLRPSYIDAIETGAWSALPPGVYARGLVTTYAKAVGASHSRVMRMYVKERPQEAKPPEPQLISEPLVEEPRYNPELLMAAAVFALAGVLLVWLVRTEFYPVIQEALSTLAQGGAADEPAPAPDGAEGDGTAAVVPAEETSGDGVASDGASDDAGVEGGAAVASGSTSSGGVSPAPSATARIRATSSSGDSLAGAVRVPVTAAAPATPSPAATVRTDRLNLRVEATSRVWLRVIDDAEEVYTGFMEPGDSQAWEAREAFTLRTGNAGGTTVAVNGERIDRLGEQGVVLTCQWRVLEDGAIEQSC